MRFPAELTSKIGSLSDAIAWRSTISGPIVFTNGCFDLIHPGHVTYLTQARQLGAALVVGLNSDTSIHQLKGPTRPIINESGRAIVLAGLASVDRIVLFDALTPVSLISALQPDIYVKGGDYSIDTLPETPVVQSYGGQVQILGFIDGYSTTQIVTKIGGNV